MKYYFINHTVCKSTASLAGAEEITEDKYNLLIREIESFAKKAPEGRYYQLQIDGTWELRDLPPAPPPEEDPDQAEYEALLAAYEEGVNNAY